MATAKTAHTANPAAPAGRTKRVAKPAAAPERQPVKAPAKAKSAPETQAPEPKVAVVVEETKAKRIKMIRDGFTIPKGEYQALEALKLRAGSLGTPAKKSELLRAGIKVLVAMPDRELMAALRAVPAIKTGRPGKD